MSQVHDMYVVLSKENNEILGVFDNINLAMMKYNNKQYIIKGPYILNEKKNNININYNDRSIHVSLNNRKSLPNICPDATQNKNNTILNYR